MDKIKLFRIWGNALVIYALVIFGLTALFDGIQFGKDYSIINYIVRMLLGFVPALPFAIPGILMLERVLYYIDDPNLVERKLELVDLHDKRTYGQFVLHSIYLHVTMVVLFIIWKIISLFFSLLAWIF